MFLTKWKCKAWKRGCLDFSRVAKRLKRSAIFAYEFSSFQLANLIRLKWRPPTCSDTLVVVLRTVYQASSVVYLFFVVKLGLLIVVILFGPFQASICREYRGQGMSEQGSALSPFQPLSTLVLGRAARGLAEHFKAATSSSSLTYCATRLGRAYCTRCRRW